MIIIIFFFRFNTSILHNMDPIRISTQVNVKHCSLCQGDTEYYCYKCQQDLCIQCRTLHVIDLSTKHHTVTSYAEKMKYPVKSLQSGDPKQVISACSQDSDTCNHGMKEWRATVPSFLKSCNSWFKFFSLDWISPYLYHVSSKYTRHIYYLTW